MILGRCIKIVRLLLMTPFLPIILCCYYKHKAIVDMDIIRSRQSGGGITLIYSMLDEKSFRNIFYHRIGTMGKFLNIFFRGVNTLYIFDECKVDGGLQITHGTSTYVNAESIGKNCTINQNVTIGVSKGGKKPIIGNNVTIRTGAIVVGGITIGDNALIAAGSVVIRDVPANCMVAGNPAVVKKEFSS